MTAPSDAASSTTTTASTTTRWRTGVEPGAFGDTVFILAGGPSLTGFPFHRLRGHGYLLGVNDAGLTAGADGIFSLDTRWIERRRERLAESGAEAFLSIPSYRDAAQLVPPGLARPAHLFERVPGGRGLAGDPSKTHGANSGHAALNVAYHARPRRVYLLGLDMHAPRGGPLHWHPEYEWAANTHARALLDRWAVALEQPARQLRAAGVEVYNVSPDSAVRCFPKMSHPELLERLIHA